MTTRQLYVEAVARNILINLVYGYKETREEIAQENQSGWTFAVPTGTGQWRLVENAVLSDVELERAYALAGQLRMEAAS